jgi:hypothetical protein
VREQLDAEDTSVDELLYLAMNSKQPQTNLQQLARILAPALSAEQHRCLLERAEGDVGPAVSACLNGGGAAFRATPQGGIPLGPYRCTVRRWATPQGHCDGAPC